MATRNELRQLAVERLVDAQCLLDAGRHDTAAYLCGYVLEMALKACVCRRLRVNEYPENVLQGRLKTHEVDVLLLFAGLQDEVSSRKHRNLQNWSMISGWKPESRYRPHGSVKSKDAEDMIKVLSREVLPWLKKRW
jgi:HEPN domain-containing protein